MTRHVSPTPRVVIALAMLLVATSLSATTFIVPEDDEMVKKSDAIVIGVVVGASVVEDKNIETEYELAVYRVLKGPIDAETHLKVRSPGGSTGKRWTAVESAAHFRVGDHVLLFLTEHRGNWTPTDLTLGKFRFDITNMGSAVLRRDANDIVGWDRSGNPHRERLRLEDEFIGFIEEVVAGREPRNKAEYEADPSEYVAEPDESPKDGSRKVASDASKPSDTYAISFYDCALNRYPGRWTTAQMNAGIQFKKNSAQNLSGAGDGGVGTITNGLAAWTNDCNSAVNITYGGTGSALRNDAADGNHMVIFNDPSGDVPGSWGGSGTIAICFSGGGDFHTFDSNPNWVGFTSSDIVFQDGYTASEPSLNTAMTHEIGHGIGLRHSDAHYLKSCSAPGCVITCSETACDPNVEECSSNAVMTAVANNAHAFTLQTWDQNAIGALYPGSCVTVTPPTSVVATGALNAASVTVSWVNSGTATSYNVYRSTDNVTFAKISVDGTVTTTPFVDNTVAAGTAYMYKVRGVLSGTESSDSNKDFAVPMSYTDSTITATSTTVKAAHFTQLTTAANALRAMAGLGSISFTEGTPAVSGTVRRTHVTDLRTGIDLARTTLGFSAGSYSTDGTITVGVTTIKKGVVDQMRAALQ